MAYCNYIEITLADKIEILKDIEELDENITPILAKVWLAVACEICPQCKQYGPALCTTHARTALWVEEMSRTTPGGPREDS